MANIDLNQMAASIYNTVLSLQQSATEMVGLEVLWCRALPYQNGEDVIVQEYTLSNVECPQALKVITEKSDYQMGVYTFGPLGIDFEEGLTISIDISTWEAVYGQNTMPQKGDIVILKTYNRAFEVSSSQVVYTLASLPTSYKCSLTKYQRQASRRESEDFQQSMDEITVSQERLFGDAISKEVADAVVDVETSYNQSTQVDPVKDFTISSIVTEDIRLYKSHLVSTAYYDFSKAEENVKYNVEAQYDNTAAEGHWIYSAWFKLGSADVESSSFKFNDLYLKEKSAWYFTYRTTLKLEEGDEVTLRRGNLLQINGVVDGKICQSGHVIKISASDALKAQKKLTNWYSKAGSWTIEKCTTYNLFKGYQNGSAYMQFDVKPNALRIKVGSADKKITVKGFDADTWHYLALDMSQDNLTVILVANTYNANTKKYKEDEIINDFMSVKLQNFKIDSFGIECAGMPVCMTNIRLYENKYAIDDTYKVDMYSQVTRNASKLILVDTPNSANNMTFVSPIK